MNRTELNGASKPTKARFALNDKKNLAILRAAIEENLAEIAAELGITVKAGNIKFESDGTSCTVGLKVEAPDETGAIVPQHAKDFAKYWRLFAHAGLREDHLGAEVTHRGETFRLAGLAANRTKFPIVLENVETKKLILVTTVVLLQLKKEAK